MSKHRHAAPENLPELVSQLREAVKDIPDVDGFTKSDANLIRYLRARDYDLEGARKQLESSLQWRAEYKPTIAGCEACLTRPGFHSWRQIGFDLEGRAVTYSCFSQGEINGHTVEDSVRHAVYLMENLAPTLAEGQDGYVWVLDFTGITLAACNPKLAYGTNKIFSSHYPERLGYALMISAPWLFNATWTAMKAFMDPKTASKIRFVKPHELKATCDELFTPDLSSWLCDEIQINKAITPTQLRFWFKPEKEDEHDPRGCPSYLKDHVEPFISEQEKKLAENGGKLPLPEGADGTMVMCLDKKHVPHPNLVHRSPYPENLK